MSASNIKRFGSPTYSVPSGAVPCSKCICVTNCVTVTPGVVTMHTGWHDIGGTEPRYAGSTGTIQTIAMQLKQVVNQSLGEFTLFNVLALAYVS